MGVLVYWFIENKWIWIGMQLFVVLSLYVGIRFFYLMHKPYKHLRDSIEGLEKQDFSSSILPSGDSIVDKLTDKYNVIMSSIRAERVKLEGQGQFLQELVSSSPLGIIITDFDDIITEVNPSALFYLNLENMQIIGQPLNRLNIDIREVSNNETNIMHIGTKKFKAIQTKVRHKGFYRNCLILEDITSEILKTEKEAYGRVIRMMSHEVNNSTGAINSILHSISEYFHEKPDGHEWQDIIQVAIHRNLNVATFVKNFASVIRVYEPNKQEVNINNLVKNTVKIWEHEVKKRNINLCLKSETEQCNIVYIDPVQMEQVFNNIIKNAIESIEQNGEICIEIMENGRKIAIADNGPGISVEDLECLHSEAFFSTKPRGQGIGMMLIREILSKHDAFFGLKTYEDGWTRFVIKLEG